MEVGECCIEGGTQFNILIQEDVKSNNSADRNYWYIIWSLQREYLIRYPDAAFYNLAKAFSLNFDVLLYTYDH